VLVVEHERRTRGNPWYSNLTCLAVDPSQSTPVGTTPGQLGTTGVDDNPNPPPDMVLPPSDPALDWNKDL
jgi:hypothetical protein